MCQRYASPRAITLIWTVLRCKDGQEQTEHKKPPKINYVSRFPTNRILRPRIACLVHMMSAGPTPMIIAFRFKGRAPPAMLLARPQGAWALFSVGKLATLRPENRMGLHANSHLFIKASHSTLAQTKTPSPMEQSGVRPGQPLIRLVRLCIAT